MSDAAASSTTTGASSGAANPAPRLKLVIPPDPVITDAQQDAIRAPHVMKVQQILHHLHLEQYFDALIDNGYDDVRSLYCLTEGDLVSMSFETRHAQRFLKWVRANSAAMISPKPPGPDEAPVSPQVERREWAYTRPANQTPISPTSTSETFVHSPYTFFPYAAVSPSSVTPTPTMASPGLVAK
eukprot:TRINITY_DN2639_c0_g1_i1.p2 TRINITY_DN2639_c0_g1~~TRINITY_DN2639_c0_g1_i1.p2  ORF type:complete len:191 (-),score=70.57 TRINITY_DN2639_c0_g1_i1:640-1191(-)